MISTKIVLGLMVLSMGLVCCGQEIPPTGNTELDSTMEAVIVTDSVEFSFNSENEFLGLGTAQFGDLDSMIARRRIRVLVPYTNLYYNINLTKRSGVAFEVMNMFEASMNKRLRLKYHPIKIIFIPVSRAQIIPLLQAGYADLAYAGMTITDERKEQVDFSTPSITGLKEIVVGAPSAPKLNSLADLSGKEIYLREGSSYESAVLKFNDSLKSVGLAPVTIKTIDPYLESEDILEMLNSDVIPYSAQIEDVARLWSSVMRGLVLYDKFPLSSNVSYGWVFRKDSPKLKAESDKFLQTHAKGTKVGNSLYNKYVKNTKRIPAIYSDKTVAKIKVLKAPFLKYGERYHLDWLLLVAQGYQESRLNQKAVSNRGAVGVMQVLPSTAAGHPFYIRNIRTIDNNVHAGVKYMRYLIDTYFSDPEIDELNKHLLALAAYNCGPGRVSSLRKHAKAKGLNPNKWFDNVEIMAAREVGQETVGYVSNIYKFYASYRALSYYADQRGKKIE